MLTENYIFTKKIKKEKRNNAPYLMEYEIISFSVKKISSAKIGLISDIVAFGSLIFT